MTRADLRAFCLALPDVYEDYPFDENWMAMRMISTKKTFAFIYERAVALCVNVKCDPMEAEFQRSIYPAVLPAYHMNKKHWNTILLDGSMEERTVFALIEQSYQLVHDQIHRVAHR